jgi:uncharacterized repeat protein (TIGR03806 family)
MACMVQTTHRILKHRFVARLLASAVVCLAAGGTGWGDEPERPFGLESRPPWTHSRLSGSPEPPLPYTVEKTFTKIEWKAPIYLADEPGTDRLWVVLRGGEKDSPSRIVRVVDDPDADQVETLLEIPGKLVYAVCFHPDYRTNGFVYVFANGPTSEPQRNDRISRYTVTRGATTNIDPATEQVVLQWPSAGHDGGDLVFGLDGMLYVVTGDGSSDSDSLNSGQTLDDLLGSVLRIDVNRTDGEKAYAVPPDNPFVDLPGACGEIWAYGLRNPWRMAVDPRTGHLWVGNNGQDQWETAHLVRRGDNLGWSVYEGSHPFYLERKRGPTPLVPPTIEHSHAEFRSLTGGVVYYGDALSELNGAYIYGDYSSGRIWGMKHDGQRPLWHRELADTTLQIAGFRVDQRGDLLIVDYGGGIHRLVPAPRQESPAPFPTRLSETGLFESVAEHLAASGVVPYSVNVPGWADGAEAERFIALAGSSQIGFAERNWTFPDGTALVQTLSRGGSPPRRIETRVLLRQQGEWAGYSYRWNEAQTDAVLVGKEGDDAELSEPNPAANEPRMHAWRFPSRGECMMCHSRAANYVLGLSAAQTNREHDYATVRDNQLRALEHAGLFAAPLGKPPGEWPRLVDPRDSGQDLEARARAYLEVNCSVCHVSAGGGNSQIELTTSVPRDRMNLLDARPQHDTFGVANAMLLAPGDPDRSIILERLARRGRGQMPPLASRQVDQQAVALVREWIASLKPTRPVVRRWTMDELEPQLSKLQESRSGAAGLAAFRETGCIQCHRFGSEGGSVGPDLTGIAKRSPARQVLESILLPSKVIADEYAAYAVETTDGRVLSGRIEREDDRAVTLRPAAAGEQPIEILKSDVAGRHRLDRSNMPTGTVDVLREEEVLDLLAYLLNGAAPSTGGGP